MGFKELFLPSVSIKRRELLEIYSIRESGELIITECKLLLDGKLVCFGLSRSDKSGFKAHIGRRLALAEAAKLFFKTEYNLTIQNNAEADNIIV
jgi:hypothetical protein